MYSNTDVDNYMNRNSPFPHPSPFHSIVEAEDSWPEDKLKEKLNSSSRSCRRVLKNSTEYR